MREINLDFSFKGNRTYVHGTDIYRQIISNIDSDDFGIWDYFEINIKKISNCNMTCLFSDKKQKRNDEVVNFVLKNDTKKIFGSIIENSQSEIKSKYSFDDENISKYCTIDINEESITYNNSQNEFETIDVLIEMSKLYLEASSDDTEKWFFRTLKIFRPIENIETKQFKLIKTGQKMNIAIFEMFIGEELVSIGYAASIPK